MRKVIFIQRNKKAGFSIDKVARPIIENTDNKEELSVPSSGAGLQDLFKNLIFVLKHRDKKAIHHITGDIHYCLLSLIGCKTVLTVHDTVTLDYNTKKNIKYYIKKCCGIQYHLESLIESYALAKKPKNMFRNTQTKMI